jgi:hypothetical protein
MCLASRVDDEHLVRTQSGRVRINIGIFFLEEAL